MMFSADVYAAPKAGSLGKWCIADAKKVTATPSMMRSTPTASPMNQRPVIGICQSTMTPNATETIPEKTAQPQLGNFAIPEPMARNSPPTMKNEARTTVRVSAPISGYRTSKYPVNPRNSAVSRYRKNPPQVPVVNDWISATPPPIRSNQPTTNTVVKVAVMLNTMQATPRAMNKTPRNRNQPQDPRISSIPAMSGLSVVCDMVFSFS